MNLSHARILLGLFLLALLAIVMRAIPLQAVTVRNTGVLAFNRSVVAPAEDQAGVETAESRLQLAASLNPSHQSTQRLLGYVYLASGQEDAALDAWRKAGSMGSELVRRGGLLEEEGMVADALRWYERATVAQPTLADGWLRAGALLEQQEAWSAAVDTYAASVVAGGAASESSDLHFRLANALMRQPEPIDWPRVLAAAKQAQTLDTFAGEYNDVQVHYVAALAQLALGQPIKAQTSFARVVAARPDDYWSNVQLGRLALSNDNDPALAARYFHAAIDANPTNKAAYRDLAELLESGGRTSDAAALYERLLVIDPDDNTVRERLNALRQGE